MIKVVTNLEGQFICQVGSSEEGLLDGPFDAALFNRPQVRKQLLLPYNRFALTETCYVLLTFEITWL